MTINIVATLNMDCNNIPERFQDVRSVTTFGKITQICGLNFVPTFAKCCKWPKLKTKTSHLVALDLS